MELVSKLGANRVADYSSADFEQELLQGPRFDFILDCVGLERPMTHMLRRGSFATYVTVNSPLLKNTDDLGLVPGLATSACQALQFTLRELADGHSARWAFFSPSGEALKEMAQLVQLGKVVPVVQKSFPFEEAPAAYRRTQEGHARGKTVLCLKD